MALILGMIGGAMIGGFLFSSLFAWLLRRIVGLPLGGSYFFGWIGCCLLAAWGFSGDGARAFDIGIAFLGYGIGAGLAYALYRRRAQTEDEVADFE